MPRPRVLIAYKSLPAYRVRFFEELRRDLREDGIDLDVVYGNPDKTYQLRGDTRSLRGGIFLRNRMLDIRGRRLIWQPILRHSRAYDLVILEQASSLLVNYPLLLLQRLGNFPRVALWGHGANLQSSAPDGAKERFKRFYSRLPHWWFAYTEGSAQRVRNLGFSTNRVTVVQNAIDTLELRRQIVGVSVDDLEEFRRATDSVDGDTALFIGSLYTEKRLDFLLASAILVHQRRPNFRLLIVGDGPERPWVAEAAAAHSFVKYLGRLDGHGRAVALRASDCVLMPGLVGLGILDAFAADAPMITTAHDFHSPEVEYLETGLNGVMLRHETDVGAYASAVVDLLSHDALRNALSAGCASASSKYTNEAMVKNFRRGVNQALKEIP